MNGNRHSAASEPSDWTVEAVQDPGGSWVARIIDPDAVERLSRRCATQNEAEVFVSSVRQHLRWLSRERFVEYYRL